MKQRATSFALGSCVIALLTWILMMPGCGKKAGPAVGQVDTALVNAVLRDGDPLDEFPEYELTEDKSKATGLYEQPEMKEWYIKKVQPPPFDYGMDLSGKDYQQLRLLRYEILARNGYLFKDAALRSHFNAFEWYQPVFGVEGFKPQINSQEKAFLDKVTVLEGNELQHRHVDVQGYTFVSVDHIVNAEMFPPLGDSLRAALQSMNFAIVPGDHDQLFTVYDGNQYSYIPNFITTDLYLQVLHKYTSGLMKDAEEQTLIANVQTLVTAMRSRSHALAATVVDGSVRKAAMWADTYLAVAMTALNGASVKDVPDGFLTEYQTETGKVLSATGTKSAFLNRILFDYSQFTPRGNYTDTETRRGYFRCFKWLNSAPLNIDDEESFNAALLFGLWVNEDARCRDAFSTVQGIVTCLAGDEDNVSITHVASALRRHSLSSIESLFQPQTIAMLREEMKAFNVSRIEPKAGNDVARAAFAKKAILFMAGRYSLDAEVLIHLVHVERPDTLRPFPKGLDVFAALGNSTAERILTGTYQEKQHWPAYGDSLNAMKETCRRFDKWNGSVSSKTLECIAALGAPVSGELPLFMRTASWQEKNLLTSLAGWTELKHDMILYSEQPFAAEAGEGGGPEPPVHLSYVEPNVPFWTKAIELLAYQDTTLSRLGALSADMKTLNQDLAALAGNLLAISRKELAKERITTKEFNTLSWIGGEVERLTLCALGTDHLPERERQIALVADVYSRNGVSLEEAVGLGDDLYVVAEINGMPYLAHGACFSYYEFKSDTRLTDEEWQNLLAKPGHPERPVWVSHLLVRPEVAFGKSTRPTPDFMDHH
jgi:hypothetical protein